MPSELAAAIRRLRGMVGHRAFLQAVITADLRLVLAAMKVRQPRGK